LRIILRLDKLRYTFKFVKPVTVYVTSKHPAHSDKSLIVLTFSSVGCWLFVSRLISFGLLFILWSCLFLTLFFISGLFLRGFLLVSGLFLGFLSLGVFFFWLLSFTLSFGFCFLFSSLLFTFRLIIVFFYSFVVLFFRLSISSLFFSISVLLGLVILGGILFFCLSFAVLVLISVHISILAFSLSLCDRFFLLFDFSIFFGTVLSCWLFLLLNNLSFFNWSCVTVLIGGVLRLNLSCWFRRLFYRLIYDLSTCLKFFRLCLSLSRSRSWGRWLSSFSWTSRFLGSGLGFLRWRGSLALTLNWSLSF